MGVIAYENLYKFLLLDEWGVHNEVPRSHPERGTLSFATTMTVAAIYAAFSSDVQCGHRVAAIGMSVAQNGHGLVVTAAAGFL